MKKASGGKTRRRREGWCRVASALLAMAVLAAFLPNRRAWQAAALVAAGLRRPENAAGWWGTEGKTGVAGEPQRLEAAKTETPEGETSVPVAEESAAVSASVTVPAEDGSGGKIVERKLAVGNTLLHGIAVKNRSTTAVDIAAALQTPLTQHLTDTAEPQVLIVHTHTTEGYMQYDTGYYNAADRARTADLSRSVCAVGAAVVKALQAGGVAAVQDTTVHDSPQYSGAYTRSAETVQRVLEKHPSVRLVLDLHRDAVMEGEKTLVKPTVEVKGKKAAQMMIVVGVVSTKALPNPNCAQNLALAAQWQKALTAVNEDLMRPLSTVASRYNQHLFPGYLLVEVGSEGNTVEEATYSGELLAQTLLQILR